MPHIKVHELKIQHQYYWDVIGGFKTAELRMNDRDFKVGDMVKLLDPLNKGLYTLLIITHVCDYPDALKEGYVMLSFKMIHSLNCSRKGMIVPIIEGATTQ
jgi:hypothetical protein